MPRLKNHLVLQGVFGEEYLLGHQRNYAHNGLEVCKPRACVKYIELSHDVEQESQVELESLGSRAPQVDEAGYMIRSDTSPKNK